MFNRYFRAGGRGAYGRLNQEEKRTQAGVPSLVMSNHPPGLAIFANALKIGESSTFMRCLATAATPGFPKGRLTSTVCVTAAPLGKHLTAEQLRSQC